MTGKVTAYLLHWLEMSKQLHSGAIKPEPGFCGSGFTFFRSVRCPFHWIRVTSRLWGQDWVPSCLSLFSKTKITPVESWIWMIVFSCHANETHFSHESSVFNLVTRTLPTLRLWRGRKLSVGILYTLKSTRFFHSIWHFMPDFGFYPQKWIFPENMVLCIIKIHMFIAPC